MLNWIFAWAAATASLSVQNPAPAADSSLIFGARENVEFAALSPDGNQLAYAIPSDGQGSRLMTVAVGANQPRHVISVDGRRQRLGGCDWVSNQRLVCTVFGVADSAGLLVNATRLIALNVDGSDVKVLGERDSADQVRARLYGGTVIDWLPGQDNQVLMQQQFIPEARAGTLLSRTEDGLGVVQIDTLSLRSRQIEDAHPTAIRYLSDGRGTVRIMSVQEVRGDGMATNLTNHFYRRQGSSEWHRLGEYNGTTRRGIWPAAVDAERNAAYVFEQQADGRDALVRISLDGSDRRDLTIAHPHVDVDSLLRIGRAGRVVGASYATDRRQTIYFDPELQRIAQQLSRALPDSPLINFVGASEDEKKLLILAGSDTDPGTYYVLDRQSRQLVQLMRSRPELEGVQLATVEPVTYRAADGTQIPAYLTLPPGGARRGLPAIVMPHGGPSARDEWGFDWLAQYFANRGYAVLQPNFRGSAGYGSEWFQTNGFQSWNVAIGDVNDAGRWLISEGIADPAKLAIVGWSYGGYAALQSGVVDPDLYKAIVAIAPVTDLQETKDEWRRFTNAANVRDFIGSGPHVAAGSPARHAAVIRAPVLLVHGEMDRNVGIRQSRLMRDRLRDAGKRVELIEFPGLDHQLEDSAARRQMLMRSDQFLRQALGL
jgi:acetyl esterase/lipase